MHASTIFPALAAVLLSATAAAAQSYSIPWHAINGGGGASTGDGYTLHGTIGQSDAGTTMTGGNYSLTGGFWSLTADELSSEPTILFDNSSGIANGQQAASTVSWLAGKFCLGSEGYMFHSVTLFLNSGDVLGRAHETTIRLQIYSHNPINGRPAVNVGPTMTLVGTTNPISLAAGNVSTPFTWAPSEPFHLAAHQCYWAVLSVESGAIAYQAISSTTPGGAAGTLGRSYSQNAGASWVPSDANFNYKMRILGTLSTPPQLVIGRSGGSAVLGWPTNAPGYILQSTTDLLPLPVWGTVSPAPVVVDGRFTVTNPVSGAQKFYRLMQ